MYNKYLVYIDDGQDVYRVAIAAVSEDAARAWCAGNGEIVAIKDITEECKIYETTVSNALIAAGFDRDKVALMCRALSELGIIE